MTEGEESIPTPAATPTAQSESGTARGFGSRSVLSATSGFKSSSSSIKVKKFDGTKRNWIPFIETWIAARAGPGGYKDLVLGKTEIPKSNEANLTADEMVVKALNEEGLGSLMASIDTSTTEGYLAFNIVRVTKTEEYEEGHLGKAIVGLRRKYEPESIGEKLRLVKEFWASKLKTGTDPDMFLLELEEKRIRLRSMGSVISDDQLVEHVMSTLPKEYITVKRILEDKKSVTIDDLQLKLSEVWEDVKPRENEREQEELALFSFAPGKGRKQGGFKGKCFGCGKIGHRKADCRKAGNGRPENEQGQRKDKDMANVKCHNCHKFGHFARNCRKKDNKEKAYVAKAETQTDVVLLARESTMDIDSFFDEFTPDFALHAWDCKPEVGNFEQYFGDDEGDDVSVSTDELDERGIPIISDAERARFPPRPVLHANPMEGLDRIQLPEYIVVANPDPDHALIHQSMCSSEGDELSDGPNDGRMESEQPQEPQENSSEPSEVQAGQRTDSYLSAPMEEEDGWGNKKGSGNMQEGDSDSKSSSSIEYSPNPPSPGNCWRCRGRGYYGYLCDCGGLSYGSPQKFCSVTRPGHMIGQCLKCHTYGPVEEICEECRKKKWRYKEVDDPLLDIPGKQPNGFYLFMKKVAEEEGLSKDWLTETLKNLIDINVCTVCDVVKNIFEINRMLKHELYKSAMPVRHLERMVSVGTTMMIESMNREFMYMASDVPRSPREDLELFYCDSGASTHMGCSDIGMSDIQNDNSIIKMGGTAQIRAAKIGKKHLVLKQKGGVDLPIVLHPFKYVPGLETNLFSLTQAMMNGWQIGNDGLHITVTKDGMKIVFDILKKTQTGFLCAVEGRPVTQADDESNLMVDDGKTVIDINRLHRILFHTHEDAIRKTAEFYKWKVSGKLEVCEDCARAKIKSARTKKLTETKANEIGERIFLDISSTRHPSMGGRHFWILVLDDFTGYHWSFFVKQKSELTANVATLVMHLKNRYKVSVKNIRCDDAGENKALQTHLEFKGSGIGFEYTGPSSPQFNGRVERKFATLWGRIRATTFAAIGEDAELRNLLWSEAARFGAIVDNLCVGASETEPAHNKVFGSNHISADDLHEFGEMAIVAIDPLGRVKAKMAERGRPCMYTGPALDHAAGTNRFLNLGTRKIITSRHTVWLKKVYKDWVENKKTSLEDEFIILRKAIKADQAWEQPEKEKGARPPDPEDEDDLPPLIPRTNQLDPDSDDEEEEATARPQRKSTSNDKVTKEMHRLGMWFNPEAKSLATRVTDLQEESRSRPTRSSSRIANVQAGRMEAMAEIEAGKTRQGTVFQQQIAPDDTAKLTYESSDEGFESPTMMIDRCDAVFNNNTDISFYRTETAFYVNDGQPDRRPVKADMRLGRADMRPEYYKDAFENPENYHDAWYHADPFQRTKWRTAIDLEFRKMSDHDVWRKVPRSRMPPDRRCVKSKWIFEIKRNGTFRARLVACGYSQVPGIDYKDTYSPVADDITFRIVLITQLLWKLKATLIDIETAFLHGELEEEIYMECPDGMDKGFNECLLLRKTIYGLVQAARAFNKKLVRVLQAIGFVKSDADPCLFIRKNNGGIVYMIIHVDDIYTVGHPKELADAINGIKKYFKIKVEENTKDYLSCEIKISKDGGTAWIGQPHLLKKLDSVIGKVVEGRPTYRTPGTPGFRVIRPKENEDRLDPWKQTLYRSVVGMLLYLIKHSRPDIANAVRELAKGMDLASPAAMKECERVSKFVLDTRNLGLKISPKKPSDVDWQLIEYTDSDFAGDTDTRRSVTGYAMFLMGAPILWKSRGQRTVSLSSSEAETNALSDGVKEIKFVVQILISMRIPVTLPINVFVDNMGSVFMARNHTASSRTRHIDTRNAFVREMQDEGFLKITYVKTEDNKSDIMTKNVNGDTFDKHSKAFMIRKNDVGNISDLGG